MTYQEFREKIINLPKYPGCKTIERCPLVTPGFPGAFNMSFGEDPILKEFGKYQFFDHDAIFSTIQKVIRHNDVFDGVKTHPEKYLGVFEMADIFGLILLKEKIDFKDLQEKQVEATIKLLTSLGIKKENIYPKYCGGGSVEKLTAGKYNFKFKVPEDTITLKALLKNGIPSNNIKKDYTRDTLLALNLASGNIAWGYRTEIEIMIDGKLLDIATLEIFMWDPIIDDKKIIGLKDITYTLALTVTGVERLYLATNNLSDVRDIEHIKKLYKLANEDSVQVEYLRTLHSIFSDQEKYGLKFGKHRQVYINRMAREINFSSEMIKRLLELNSKLQPWYPELEKGITPTIKFLEMRS